MRYQMRYVIVDTEFPGMAREEVVITLPLAYDEAKEKQEMLNQPVIEGDAREIKPGEREPKTKADRPTYGVNQGLGGPLDG